MAPKNHLKLLSSRLFTLIKESKLVKDIGWNVSGGLISKAIGPVFTILIARLLTPEDYGVFGITIATIALIELFKDVGLREAVIADHGKEDFISLQFTVQFWFAFFAYSIILIGSGWVSVFYNMPDLKQILPLVGLTIFFSVIEDPLVTNYLKESNYKLLFYRRIIPSVTFGVIALGFAFLGYGVFALVFGHLASRFLTMLFFLLKSDWRPKFLFKKKVFFHLFKTGKHLLFQRSFGYLALQADSLVVGKILGGFSLGLYRMSRRLTLLIPTNIMPQIEQVVFTDMAKNKNNSDYVRKRYYDFILISGSLLIILSLIIFWTAPLIIPLVLGEKWIQTIPMVRLFSLAFPFSALVILNQRISIIYNFSHVYTYFNIARGTITIAALYWASTIGINFAVFVWVIVAILFTIVNSTVFFLYQRNIKINKIVAFAFLLSICNAIIGLLICKWI